jgi:hypothetical protein
MGLPNGSSKGLCGDRRSAAGVPVARPVVAEMMEDGSSPFRVTIELSPGRAIAWRLLLHFYWIRAIGDVGEQELSPELVPAKVVFAVDSVLIGRTLSVALVPGPMGIGSKRMGNIGSRGTKEQAET